MKPKHNYLETIKVIIKLFYKSKKYLTSSNIIYEYDFYLELLHKESAELSNLFRANEYLKDLIIEDIKEVLKEEYGGVFECSNKYYTEIVYIDINKLSNLRSINDTGLAYTFSAEEGLKEVLMKQISVYGLYMILVRITGNK